MKSNNRGLSLVELIVSISIGAIIAAAVSALIGYSVRIYHNESVNTAMQYEIQTNVNQLMDAIMSSSGVVIVQDGTDKTDYAGFGKFVETRTGGVVTSVKFSGIVVKSGTRDGVKNTFDIYLMRVSDAAPKTGATAQLAVAAAAQEIIDATDKKPYLLGQNAKEFKLSVDTNAATSNCIVSSTEYINPLTVAVELEFEKNGTGKPINKRVKDNAIMRNKVTSDIYIDGNTYKLKK